MSKAWPKVRLGELLTQRKPDVRVEQTEAYQFAGVYCFGRGVFKSQERSGTSFAYPVLTKLRAGEFTYPKLMAWEGAFGIVPPACDGFHVSPEFPVFEIDQKRLLPDFLGYYFKIPAVWEAVSGGSTGTNIRRRRLNPSDFLATKFALPPLAEQHRIVARVEEVAAQIQEARGLRRQAADEADQMMAAEERLRWSDAALVDAPILETVCSFLARGRQSEQGESDHYLIKTQHVQQGRYVPTTMRLAPHVESKVNAAAVAQDGDTLIACSAAGCLGRVARFRGVGVKASTDTHVAIARANPDIVHPDYLYAYLRGAQGQHQLRSRERGDWQREKTSFRLTELNLNDLKKVPIPVPPLPEQRRIVAELDAFQTEVDALKHLQAETAAELDALLPAILDKAFNGEL
jgi:type I restriction enzyme, S subunit